MGLILLAVLCMHGMAAHWLSRAWHPTPSPTTTWALQWQPPTQANQTTQAASAPAAPRKRRAPQAPAPHETTTGFLATEGASTAPTHANTANDSLPPTTDPEPSSDQNPSVADAGSSQEQPTTNPTTTEPIAAPAPPSVPPNDVSQASSPTPRQDSTTQPAWLSEARFVWPPSARLLYEVTGESKGIRYSANGELVWQHDGRQYQMKLEISHMLLGARTQTSVGELGAQGLQPKRFGDKYKQEVAAHFDRDKGQVIFSANSTPQTLQAAAQDRLSLFAQFAALLAGSPALRQPGQTFALQVVSSKSSDAWTFQVDGPDTLTLPVGKTEVLKLSRQPLQTYDQTVDIWLSPSHGYLPVKVRIAQTNGDVLEQSLRQVVKP